MRQCVIESDTSEKHIPFHLNYCLSLGFYVVYDGLYFVCQIFCVFIISKYSSAASALLGSSFN